ncbi:MAG: threonylcarbamoyl-AMP synthase [Actinobacteria bacterium]|nr:threonylcarbamoyl-AMP synthase [Actinomycetota bacterium]
MSTVVSLGDPQHAREVACARLREGLVVVLPTDTAYAAVADAFSMPATGRLRDVTGRGRSAALPVVIRSPRQTAGLVADVPEAAERLMASYWPGPLSLVLPAVDGLTWDLGETHGTVTLRIPADDLLLAVIAEIGPLACTGATRPGGSPPRTVDEARAGTGGRAALYVEAAPAEAAVSTIVDVTRGRVAVLREGAVPAADVEAVAGGAVGWGERPAARVDPERA